MVSMLDEIMCLGDGLIHHGKHSNRIYVLKAPKKNSAAFIDQMEALAAKNGYGKIIVKAMDACRSDYLAKGYAEEAFLPNYYEEGKGCAFLGKYCLPERQKVKNKAEIEQVLAVAQGKRDERVPLALEEGFRCEKMQEIDVADMAALYKKVFASYPFPIHEEQYIKETMRDNVIYFGIRQGEDLVGLSSAEIDWQNRNAEMTDFAVAPSCRGKNISFILLNAMEVEVEKAGIGLVYTIARSVSHGMNVTFSRQGYIFAGTLFNNTQIAGKIESMNIWYKKLSGSHPAY